MRLPSKRETRLLLKEHKDPDEFMAGRMDAHIITVRRMAKVLGKRLRKQGHDVDLKVIDKAAILHDLTKKTGDEHAASAAKILEEKGCPELARVIGSHDTTTLLRKNRFDISLEEMVLMYADARSGSGRIMGLEERSKLLQERYPHRRQDIRKSFKKLRRFELWLNNKGVDHEVEIGPKDLAEIEFHLARR